MSENRQALPTLARILFWLALTLAFVMALLPAQPQLLDDDKSQHMLAFAALALLMGVGWPRLALWRIALMMGLFGALIEVVQWSLPALGRTGDVADWWADMIATGAALVLVALLRAGLRRRSPDAAG